MSQYPQQPIYYGHPPRSASGFGVASLVISIIALVGCWVPVVGFVLAGIGLLLAFCGMLQNSDTTAKGTVIAGGILSLFAIIPSLVYMLLVGGALFSKAAHTAAAASQRAAIAAPATQTTKPTTQPDR